MLGSYIINEAKEKENRVEEEGVIEYLKRHMQWEHEGVMLESPMKKSLLYNIG